MKPPFAILFLCFGITVFCYTVSGYGGDVDQDCKIGCLAVENPMDFCLQLCHQSSKHEWLDS